MQDPSRYHEHGRSTSIDLDYRLSMESYIQNSLGTSYEKYQNFPKYTSRQSIARYIALYEIFKISLHTQGDIIEGGVNWGGGLMWAAQLSAMLEPFNLQRRIIGFDTFEGFPSLHSKDDSINSGKEHTKGGYAAHSYDDLLMCISNFDKNRAIGHISKVSLIKGDATLTMPQYLKDNPHTIVSLLHLDFDIYEPTISAIKTFLPRMPKGAVIVFDEINCPKWPGETQAVIESIGLNNLEIKRFSYEPYISYAIIN